MLQTVDIPSMTPVVPRKLSKRTRIILIDGRNTSYINPDPKA